jgi:L-rhamnose mutarotase
MQVSRGVGPVLADSGLKIPCIFLWGFVLQVKVIRRMYVRHTTGFWTRTYQLVYRCNIENNNCFLDESPAFVCEKVSVELEIDRMTDMAVNEMMKTKNVLYISRGQLKNHTSTVINFTIGTAFQIFIDRIAIRIGLQECGTFPSVSTCPCCAYSTRSATCTRT